jgi:hypothetical protein
MSITSLIDIDYGYCSCPTAVGLFIPRKTNRTGVRGLYGSDTDILIIP